MTVCDAENFVWISAYLRPRDSPALRPRIAPHGPSSANRAGPLKSRGALQHKVEVPGRRIATLSTAVDDEGPDTHADGRRGLLEVLSCDIAHHRTLLVAPYDVLWSGCGHRDRLRLALLVVFLWSLRNSRRLTVLWSLCGLAIRSRMAAGVAIQRSGICGHKRKRESVRASGLACHYLGSTQGEWSRTMENASETRGTAGVMRIIY